MSHPIPDAAPEPLLEHATMCPRCEETLFGDETCESIDCPCKPIHDAALDDAQKDTLVERLEDLCSIAAIAYDGGETRLLCKEAAAAIRERDERIAVLTALLNKYGRHTGHCNWRGGRDCDCGWDILQQEGEKP